MEIANKTILSERQKIDIIDTSIITLLDLRIRAVGEIGRIKRIKNIPILDKSREEQIIKKIDSTSTNSNLIIPIFHEIMNQSKKLQNQEKWKSA